MSGIDSSEVDIAFAYPISGDTCIVVQEQEHLDDSLPTLKRHIEYTAGYRRLSHTADQQQRKKAILSYEEAASKDKQVVLAERAFDKFKQTWTRTEVVTAEDLRRKKNRGLDLKKLQERERVHGKQQQDFAKILKKERERGLGL